MFVVNFRSYVKICSGFVAFNDGSIYIPTCINRSTIFKLCRPKENCCQRHAFIPEGIDRGPHYGS